MLPKHALLSSLPLVQSKGLNFDFPNATDGPVPFNISVDKTFIDETMIKVGLYRPSIDLEDDSNSNWIEGPPSANMSALAKDWANDYDWFEIEEEINANFSHYAIVLPGTEDYDHEVPLHFVHERSDDPDAFPILLLHGWPSTFVEWSKVIHPLVSANSNTTFHVVAPDVPGFGFSPAPTHSGLGPVQMSYIMDNLMQELGYKEYGVVSTDLGWMIAMWMGHTVSDHVKGHFSDFFLVQPNATDLERLENNETSPEEAAYISSVQWFFANHSAYWTVQAQSPLNLGQALSDTPVGFAGWIWHLMFAFSDGYDYSFQEIITDAMLLWIQGTWGNLRSYKEYGNVSPRFIPGFWHHTFAIRSSIITPMQERAMDYPKTNVPTGVTQWGFSNGPYPEVNHFHLIVSLSLPSYGLVGLILNTL